jgi:hypothetical protein
MPKVAARKNIERTSIEFRTYDGRESGRQYLLLKAHARKSEFFQAFASVELKGACLDINGVKDTPKTRRVHANELARKLWYNLNS